MPRKQEEWIEARDAAIIMSERSGHTVSLDYVRLLGNKGKIATKPKDLRTKLYLKSDVEAYRVRRRKPATEKAMA
jgi:hypothetical protein